MVGKTRDLPLDNRLRASYTWCNRRTEPTVWELVLWLTRDECVTEEHATENAALEWLHEQLDAGIPAVAWELSGPDGEYAGQDL